MGLPADTYRQLTAMANAADRGNRPTTLLAVPALAVIAGLIVLFVSWSGYAQKRDTLGAMEYQTQRLARLVGQYESIRAAQVNETRQYPPIPDFELKDHRGVRRRGHPLRSSADGAVADLPEPAHDGRASPGPRSRRSRATSRSRTSSGGCTT